VASREIDLIELPEFTEQFSTDFCLTRAPAQSTATACTDRMNRHKATVSSGGYQVGAFRPAGQSGTTATPIPCDRDEGQLPEFAARITGSADFFCTRHGRKPWASVNYVTAHGRLHLNDLVSCGRKHNEANGEENRDGSSDNHSWNHGVEGPSEDSKIVELRERQKRNFLETLLFSQGAPMVLADTNSVGHNAETIMHTAKTTRFPG
jgi:isoamylase